MAKQTYKTNLRMLMVVDGTGSMDVFSEMVKNFLKNAHHKIVKVLGDAGREVETIEIQLAVFRDFFEEKGKDAFNISKVFNLSTDKEEFDREVDNLTWYGGGDDPESSLQGLFLALKRADKIETDATKKRFVVCFFTDNPSHSFEEFEKRGGIERFPDYPISELPKSLDAFCSEYHSKQGIFGKHMGVELKDVRLNIFAPENAYPYDSQNIGAWENVTIIPIKENGNLDDVTEDAVLATIAASY